MWRVSENQVWIGPGQGMSNWVKVLNLTVAETWFFFRSSGPGEAGQTDTKPSVDSAPIPPHMRRA